MNQAVMTYIDENRENFIREYIDWCSIPSVSADSRHAQDMHRAADWALAKLRGLGFKAEKYETPKHPIIVAERSTGDTAMPTILFYGHYDVQPVDPLNEWKSDPFAPEVRDNFIFGRGVSDMKGETLSAILGVQAVLQVTGKLPVNVKFLIEGEEEIGSPSISDFFHNHKELLAADLSINLDSGMVDKDTPAITYGLRGIAGMEIKLTGPDHDLHSGSFGGTVQNPAMAMAKLLAGIHDANGYIQLPGFYDKVRVISPEEHEILEQANLHEADIMRVSGAPARWGEKGFSVPERLGARPTFEVNGLWSGYTGEGGKTIIPSSASVKVTMRLVPDQDPAEITAILEKYVRENTPKTMHVDIKSREGGFAFIMDPNNAEVDRYAAAIEEVWGKKPVLRREGGGIPIVIKFRDILGINSILAGFSSPDSNAHGPNENLNLDTWVKGIKTVAVYLQSYAS